VTDTLIIPSNHVASPKLILDWIEQVSRRDFEAIGFLTRQARDRYHRQGKIKVYYENGEPTAFCLHSGLQKTRTVQIHQSLTIDPARRLLHQSALVHHLRVAARHAGAVAIKLRVADDLPANLFWMALGAEQYAQERGGKRRGRIINLYRLPLQEGSHRRTPPPYRREPHESTRPRPISQIETKATS
jgi:hypothetical protein